VGGVIAAAISTVAFIKSLKTQGGVETLKRAANEASDRAEQVTEPQPEEGISTSPPSKRVSWTTWHESRGRYRLRNDSIHTGATAELVGFQDVTPSGGNDAHTAVELPVMLAPNENIPFTIEKSLASPSVTAIEITYRPEGRGLPLTTTLYV